MRIRWALMIGMAAVAAWLAVGTAQADRRQYLATYGYYTPAKGEWELEQWTELFDKKDEGAELRSRTELEHGLTDRLAASLYLKNKRPSGSGWEYDETSLELRYRLTQPGKRFWDTTGYVEVTRPEDPQEPYEIEAKGIFSHNFPRFNVSVNLKAEREMESGAGTELGYAVGISPYPKGPTNVSFEAFGEENEHYIMPAFWISPGMRQNFGIGLAAGLTRDSDRLQVRTLYSYEF